MPINKKYVCDGPKTWQEIQKVTTQIRVIAIWAQLH